MTPDELEAIRMRVAGRRYVTGIIEARVWQDRRALLSHADEQAKRIEMLEGALRKIDEILLNTVSSWAVTNMRNIIHDALCPEQLTLCLFKGCYGTAEDGGYCGLHQFARAALAAGKDKP